MRRLDQLKNATKIPWEQNRWSFFPSFKHVGQDIVPAGLTQSSPLHFTFSVFSSVVIAM